MARNTLDGLREKLTNFRQAQGEVLAGIDQLITEEIAKFPHLPQSEYWYEFGVQVSEVTGEKDFWLRLEAAPDVEVPGKFSAEVAELFKTTLYRNDLMYAMGGASIFVQAGYSMSSNTAYVGPYRILDLNEDDEWEFPGGGKWPDLDEALEWASIFYKSTGTPVQVVNAYGNSIIQIGEEDHEGHEGKDDEETS